MLNLKSVGGEHSGQPRSAPLLVRGGAKMAVAPSGAGQKQFSLPWASPSRARAGDVHRRLPKIDWTDRDKSLNPVVVCDFATQAAAFSTSHFADLASVRGCWVCTLYPISDAVHGLSVFLTLRHSAPNDLSKLERDSPA